jgi:hypothetical protein
MFDRIFAQGWSLSMWSCSRSDSEPTILWYLCHFKIGICWAMINFRVCRGFHGKLPPRLMTRPRQAYPGFIARHLCLGSGCFCLAVAQMKSSRIMEAKACPLTLGSHWVFCGSRFYMVLYGLYNILSCATCQKLDSYPCWRMVINPLIGIAVNVAIIRNS